MLSVIVTDGQVTRSIVLLERPFSPPLDQRKIQTQTDRPRVERPHDACVAFHLIATQDPLKGSAQIAVGSTWQPGYIWGRQVQIPSGFDRSLAGLDTMKPIDERFAIHADRRRPGQREPARRCTLRSRELGIGARSPPRYPALARLSTHLRINVNTSQARRQGYSDGTYRYLPHGSVIAGRVRDSL